MRDRSDRTPNKALKRNRKRKDTNPKHFMDDKIDMKHWRKKELYTLAKGDKCSE